MDKFIKEDIRQAAHLGVGVAAVLIVMYVGFNSALFFMSIIFLIGLLLVNLKMLGGKFKPIDYLLELADRNTAIPAQGAMFFAAGIMLLLVYARPLEFALAMIMLHAVGDAFATVIGVRFKSPLPWNKSKSWAGLIAFICLGLLAAQFFIPFQRAFLYAFFLGIVESLPLPIDDNVSVPIAALILSLGGAL